MTSPGPVAWHCVAGWGLARMSPLARLFQAWVTQAEGGVQTDWAVCRNVRRSGN